MRKSLYQKLGKRIFDVTLASIGLIVFAPLLALVAVLVKMKLGSPVIFRQARPGRNEQTFYLFKFRTMTQACNPAGELLPDTLRATPFGKFLRGTSLDELPELVNVIKGNMSMIGPRPLLVRYLPYFSDAERIRFLVRPGLTGLAQVRGRNDLSWDHRLQYDIEYVSRISLSFDVKIFVDTFVCVLHRVGYRADPNAIMSDLDVERQRRSKVVR
jgi:undecaprenyl phosphate N,N'-diacetylbacillosamine 1-phosphate transferase